MIKKSEGGETRLTREPKAMTHKTDWNSTQAIKLPSIRSSAPNAPTNKKTDGRWLHDEPHYHHSNISSSSRNAASEHVTISQSNLYTHSPTILFIKEKYKNYLDWLAQNSNYYYSRVGGNNMTTDNHHQLAWYDFERSLGGPSQNAVAATAAYKNKTNLNEMLSGEEQQHEKMLAYSLENLDSNTVVHNQKILNAVLSSLRSSNREIGENRRLDLDAVRRSLNDESHKKLVKKQVPRKLGPIRACKNDIDNEPSTPTTAIKFATTTSQRENQNKPQAASNSSNRVQFQTKDYYSNNTTTTTESSTSNYQPSSPFGSTPPSILKPILKHAQSMKTTSSMMNCDKKAKSRGDYLQLVYLNRNLGAAAAAAAARTKRKNSSSIDSNDENSIISSMLSYVDDKEQHLKKTLLPPIFPSLGLLGRCSDDFYAVLSDMEKTKPV